MSSYTDSDVDPGEFCKPGEDRSTQHRQHRRARSSPSSIDIKNNCGGPAAALPVKTRGAMFGYLDAIASDPRLDPGPNRCFNCWQRGHEFERCTKQQSACFCLNCGRRGCDPTDCPRCGRALRELLDREEARELEREQRNLLPWNVGRAPVQPTPRGARRDKGTACKEKKRRAKRAESGAGDDLTGNILRLFERMAKLDGQMKELVLSSAFQLHRA